MGKVAAPFRRPLKLGSRGSDVVAVKRAAHKVGGFRTGPRISPIYGPLIWAWMRRWKKKHGLPAADGSYGPGAHKSFVKRGAFDAYGGWLLQHAEWQTPVQKRRAAITKAAYYLLAHQGHITYTQAFYARWDGIRNERKPPDYPREGDCSSTATWCYWLADQEVGGVPDPNGLSWQAGFTGTMKAHGRRVANPNPGDLVLYGPGMGSHVAVYVGNGKCIGFGSPGGPKLLPVHYRPDFSEYRSYL